jgi:acyl carrier protein
LQGTITTLNFVVKVQATPETMQKVSNIVRKQLAFTPETALTPETKFSALGADSLDTVRNSIFINQTLLVYNCIR